MSSDSSGTSLTEPAPPRTNARCRSFIVSGFRFPGDERRERGGAAAAAAAAAADDADAADAADAGAFDARAPSSSCQQRSRVVELRVRFHCDECVRAALLVGEQGEGGALAMKSSWGREC